MALRWITGADLGIYSYDHNFVQDPILLNYSASAYAEISLISGELPPGLIWTYFPNYVRISGQLVHVPDREQSTDYYFTYRITDLDGSTLDQTFSIELPYDPIPVWGASEVLGTVPENYSFNLNPVRLPFSADPAAVVSQLNGSLPAGLTWSVEASNDNVVISGQSVNISRVVTSSVTFRIRNPNNTVADRTFSITITPLATHPDWSPTDPFLGYVGSGLTGTFTVVASLPGTVPLIYSLMNQPTNMQIDPIRGIITYLAPMVVLDTTITFTVRAASPDAHADLECEIGILVVPHAPVWVSPADLIMIPQGGHLEVALSAFDPLDQGMVYQIVGYDEGFPFTVDPDGLLYGPAPDVQSNTLWRAAISATSPSGSTTTTVSVLVTKVNASGVLVWRNPDDDITLDDGQRITIDIGAISTRTRTVKHGFIGGTIPPGIILDKIQGKLVGYLDYHAVDKDYWFDIMASDDVDTIYRTYHIGVSAVHGYHFSGVSIPMWGDAKQRWLAHNQAIITNPGMIPNVAVVGNQLYPPSMSLIRGLDSTITDPRVILAQLSPYLQTMSLAIGPTSNVVVNPSGDMLLYRSVIDPQSGTAFIADHVTGPPPTVRPMSLDNLRRALINACKFAGGGIGSGAGAIADIDPETGSIISANIISPGSGYIIVPKIAVAGTGQGAKLEATVGLIDLEIYDPGTGWILGDEVIVDIGHNYHPATIIVAQINGAGGLLRAVIKDPGSYYQIPIGKLYIFAPNGASAGVNLNLGVNGIDVISGGNGYDRSNTVISFDGGEILEPWQDEWEPIVPVALVTPRYSNTVINNSQVPYSSVLDGTPWQVGDLIVDVQGVFWQGATYFEHNNTTFDGDDTSTQEVLYPRETIFDGDTQTYEQHGTTFDVGPVPVAESRANWGLALWDDATTAWEFYSTIYDQARAPMESSTIVRRLVRLTRPQISGNNITDGSKVSTR